MQFRVRGICSKFIIDTSEGMVYQIHTKLVKKKEVEYKSNYKRFSKVKEAYEYLSQTERMPVWKLRATAKEITK